VATRPPGQSRSGISLPELWGLFGWREISYPPVSCEADGCTSGSICRTDLYCLTGEHFLPLQASMTGRARRIVIGLASLLALAGFFLTARFDSIIPVDLTYAAVGMAIAMFSLRKFPIACIFAILLSLIAVTSHTPC
jgi:hypothetical protein